MLWTENNIPLLYGGHNTVLNEADDEEKTSFNPNNRVKEENTDNQPDTTQTDDENYDLGDEGQDDNEPGGGGVEDQGDTPQTDDTQTATDADQGNGGGEENTDNQPDTTQTDDENYDLGDEGQDDGDTGEGDTGTEGGEEPDEDGGNTDTQDTADNEDQSSGEDPRQKLKDLEDSIFDQLSEDQKETKNKELKNIFMLVYYDSKKISDSLEKVVKYPDDVKIYEYINNTLEDLMNYIKDYLADSFDNRTYMENILEFEKYLSVLEGIKKVLVDMKKNKDANRDS